MGAAGDAWVVECAETLVRHGLTNYREVMEFYREDEKLKRLKNDFPRKRQLEWVCATNAALPFGRVCLVDLILQATSFGLDVLKMTVVKA